MEGRNVETKHLAREIVAANGLCHGRNPSCRHGAPAQFALNSVELGRGAVWGCGESELCRAGLWLKAEIFQKVEWSRWGLLFYSRIPGTVRLFGARQGSFLRRTTAGLP